MLANSRVSGSPGWTIQLNAPEAPAPQQGPSALSPEQRQVLDAMQAQKFADFLEFNTALGALAALPATDAEVQDAVARAVGRCCRKAREGRPWLLHRLSEIDFSAFPAALQMIDEAVAVALKKIVTPPVEMINWEGALGATTRLLEHAPPQLRTAIERSLGTFVESVIAGSRSTRSPAAATRHRWSWPMPKPCWACAGMRRGRRGTIAASKSATTTCSSR